MAKQNRVALGCLVSGLILLEFAYLTLTADQPTVFINEQGQPFSSSSLTAWFRVASWGALASGSLLLMYSIRIYVGKESKTHGNSTESWAKWRLLENGRIWLVFNVILTALSVWTGYAEMSPAMGERSNADLIFCVAIIVSIPVFAICTVHFSTVHDLRKPSWDRFPLNWWGDPLQTLFISTLSALGLVVGSLFRFGTSGIIEVQLAATYVSILVGLVIGQMIVYAVYRSRAE